MSVDGSLAGGLPENVRVETDNYMLRTPNLFNRAKKVAEHLVNA